MSVFIEVRSVQEDYLPSNPKNSLDDGITSTPYLTSSACVTFSSRTADIASEFSCLKSVNFLEYVADCPTKALLGPMVSLTRAY